MFSKLWKIGVKTWGLSSSEYQSFDIDVESKLDNEYTLWSFTIHCVWNIVDFDLGFEYQTVSPVKRKVHYSELILT